MLRVSASRDDGESCTNLIHERADRGRLAPERSDQRIGLLRWLLDVWEVIWALAEVADEELLLAHCRLTFTHVDRDIRRSALWTELESVAQRLERLLLAPVQLTSHLVEIPRPTPLGFGR